MKGPAPAFRARGFRRRWRLFRAVMFVVLTGWIWAAVAWADGARVKVATLDGTPVYHWTAFKSYLADDVDRALILREFGRQSFQLPRKVVDDAVGQEIADRYGGNAKRFERHLSESGTSMEDFRQFVAEEVAINAMLYQEAKTPAEQAQKQAKFLADLRAGATVKRLPAKTPRNG